MKSEKAKAIIRESDFYFQIDGVTFHEARAMMKKDAIRAVEIAEQEAEERMREKAIEAFCDECACFEACICCLPAGACDRKNNFIQKLTKK
jgi:hypothetical protein